MAGILGYGAYIPAFRLKLEDIWDIWVNPIDTPAVIKKRKNLTEKAVTRWDEDAASMGVDAAKASLEMARVAGKDLDAIYFGSSTNPCTTRPTSTTLAEAVRAGTELLSADCQFASKSGTAALQICAAMVDSGAAKYALAVGSDALSRHTEPSDPVEYSASSGAAALVVGKEKAIADIEGMYSYTTLTPEFFRVDGERYIKHAAGEEEEYAAGYTRHITGAVKGYLKKYAAKAGDFDYVAVSQPDGRLPVDVMKGLGFNLKQVNPGMMAAEVGDCGSASSLLSLAAILDQATAGQRILLVSYGSGAGCDVFGLKTTSLLAAARKRRKESLSVKDLIARKEYVGYAQYLRQERKLFREFV